MKRDEVLAIVANTSIKSNAVVFVGNGYNARALCAIADQENFFYMVGSMSLCPTLAAGFAHCLNVPVIAIEGDGNALMGLSGFPVVSKAVLGTFIHLVLDNGLYETTGKQLTLSSHVNFGLLASSAGYKHVHCPDSLSSFEVLLEAALSEAEPTFIHVRTQISTKGIHPRVPYHPQQITKRFRNKVMKNGISQVRTPDPLA